MCACFVFFVFFCVCFLFQGWLVGWLVLVSRERWWSVSNAAARAPGSLPGSLSVCLPVFGFVSSEGLGLVLVSSSSSSSSSGLVRDDASRRLFRG